jgi:AsmA protein
MTAPKRRRWLWILAAVAMGVPLVGFVALRALVNPDALRPRLVAAVEQATGRRFTSGEIGLALSLRPTVALTDIALANAEGGSRPAMLTARRVEVQVALLPLLSRRVEIGRVLLVEPDLLLERVGERGNWEFGPAAPAPAADTAPPTAPAAPAAPPRIALDALRLERGLLTWRDGATAETLEILALDAAAPLAAPARARGSLRLRGAEALVEATTGPVAAFGGPEPWPVTLVAQLPGQTRIAAEGRVLRDGAWTLSLDAQSRTPALLAPLLPDLAVVPLRDVALSGRLSGAGGALTGAEALSLRAGASDLSALRPGLSLARLDLAAPRLDAPVTLAAEASLADMTLSATGRAGPLAQITGHAPGPLPVELRLAAAGAEATARGQLADPRAMAGVDLTLTLRIPDLAAFAPLAGAPLPAVREIAAGARLAERGPGFRGGAHLRELTITSSAAEARGELSLAAGQRTGVTGRLDVARLDLDALRAGQGGPAQLAPATPAPTPTPAPTAPAPPASDGRVIPDLPLPLGVLRGFDADLRLTVARLTAGGAEWRDIRAPIRVEAGRGRIAPFAVATPGGAVTAELSADAAGATPTLALSLSAPQLDLAALQRALGQPVYLTGHGEVEADLRGAGAGLRQVAASLSGHLGLAMLDATLEPALTAPVHAALRSRVPALPDLPQRLPVECLAIRAEAEGGVLRFGTLLVDAPAAKVAGSGTVNAGTEAIALRLLHDIRAAGTELRLAADLGGTLAAPVYRGVQLQNVGAVLGGLAGRVGGDAGALLGALANRNGARPEALPECGPALAAARGGRAGPLPTPRPAQGPAAPAPEAPPASPLPLPPGPAGDLLRGLLRR